MAYKCITLNFEHLFGFDAIRIRAQITHKLQMILYNHFLKKRKKEKKEEFHASKLKQGRIIPRHTYFDRRVIITAMLVGCRDIHAAARLGQRRVHR